MKNNINELRKLEIKEDPQLLPKEKETFFHISGEDESQLFLSTAHKPFIKKALSLNDFTVSRVYFNDDGSINFLEGSCGISHLRFKENGNDEYNQFWYILKS